MTSNHDIIIDCDVGWRDNQVFHIICDLSLVITDFASESMVKKRYLIIILFVYVHLRGFQKNLLYFFRYLESPCFGV